MEHLTAQALDRVLQMPLHLSIPAIGCSADDEFENHIHAHSIIEFAATHSSVHGLPENNYAAFDVFICADVCLEAGLPVLKRPFCPRRMEITAQPPDSIRA